MILRNAAIITAGNETGLVDVHIKNGKIERVAEAGCWSKEKILEAEAGVVGMAPDEVIDCKGRLLMPGFIDAHVHLREPGFEKKETIRTGTEAAAAGGFTTIMPMPNVKPIPDNPSVMREYMDRLNRDAVVKIAPYSSITQGEKGQQVVDMPAMLEAGAAAFSDDGVGVQSDEIMKQAMEQAKALDSIIVAHTEDNSLKNNGYVHQGTYAEKMGWRGIPSACEYAQVERDIKLVRQTGCRYHVCHVSTKETIEMVRQAKAEGLPVTCEITPHHLLLIDEDVKGENWKMNPPLRGREDREALIKAIQDGTADIVATDHAPHTQEEKSRGLDKAPFGIVGLETAFPLLYTNLVKNDVLTLERIQEAMCSVPAEIFRLDKSGRIEEGCAADLVLFDLDCEYIIEPEKFKSMGKNTPFAGESVYGKLIWTMVDGRMVYNG